MTNNAEFEYELSEQCVLIGEIADVYDSFDDEFGQNITSYYEVQNFHVVAYLDSVDGIEDDVTKALSDERLNYFKELFLEKYLEHYENTRY